MRWLATLVALDIGVLALELFGFRRIKCCNKSLLREANIYMIKELRYLYF